MWRGRADAIGGAGGACPGSWHVGCYVSSQKLAMMPARGGSPAAPTTPILPAKNKNMITKPSIGFIGKASNSDLATTVDNIVSAMTDNPNYPGQQSGIADVA